MRTLLTACLVAVSITAFAGMDCVVKEFINVTNSTTSGTIQYSNAKDGFVEGIGLVVSNSTALKATGTGIAPATATPSYYVANSTFQESNAFLSIDGLYKIRYETNVWTISTLHGSATNPMWRATEGAATDLKLISTNYQAVASSGATGTLTVAASTVDIDVDVTTTAGDGTGLQRTIFSKDDITASAFYTLREPVDTPAGVETNWVDRIPLSMNKIAFNAYDCGDSNANVRFYLVIETPPRN